MQERLSRLCTALLSLCACETAAPASSSEAPTPAASDWTGLRGPLSPGERERADAAAPMDEARGTWVLHLGDSFVNASFAQHLEPLIRSAGARQVARAKASTFTTDWADDPDVDQWLARGPSLVLVTLGANEVDNVFPKLHAGAIRRLSRKVGAVAPCVWIAPTLWKADRPGWLQVLHDYCAPCLFFDSDAVLGGLTEDERRRDGIHPNDRGGQRWAEAFWGWLSDHRDPSRGTWGLVPFERR
jgi:lysophospholipase L1-like esterase